jgi:DNA-binding beta-propeller fold protein YncE
MKLNFYSSLFLSVLMISSQASIAGPRGHNHVRAFYGDKANNKVVVIDVKRMQLIKKVATKGLTPYPVDRAGYLDKVYAITRDSSSMDVIDANTLENLGLLKLNHKPRSGESYNSRLGLALIAGADKPLTSVIDVVNDAVVAEAGKDELTTQTRDNGGSISSGHPAWLTKDRFVVIDRANRLIQLWGIEKIQVADSLDYDWEVFLLDEVDTPTAVHHMLHRNTLMQSKREKRIFYALAEGKSSNEDGEVISPAILELRLTANDRLKLADQISLPGDRTLMSSHHADFHPDGQHIYVGSSEGNLFIIDRKTKSIVSTIETGLGTGHTRFVPARNLAIVTNHHDTFVTVINIESHSKVKDIVVSGPKINGEILQSHTNYVSPDSNFYYAFASDNGTFFELNLKKLKVGRTLNTGGVPVQGSFINWDDFSYSAVSSSSGM